MTRVSQLFFECWLVRSNANLEALLLLPDELQRVRQDIDVLLPHVLEKESEQAQNANAGLVSAGEQLSRVWLAVPLGAVVAWRQYAILLLGLDVPEIGHVSIMCLPHLLLPRCALLTLAPHL